MLGKASGKGASFNKWQATDVRDKAQLSGNVLYDIIIDSNNMIWYGLVVLNKWLSALVCAAARYIIHANQDIMTFAGLWKLQIWTGQKKVGNHGVSRQNWAERQTTPLES